MSTIWFTSDWHFNHQKDFIYQARGFTSPEEMNEIIIQKFNTWVRPNDDVYCLGDCMLGGSERIEEGIDLINRLNGNLHIIRGNHDSNKRWEAYHQLYPKIVELETAMFWKFDKYNFYLSHFPSLTSNYDDDKPLKQKTINLCGHTHTTDKFADIDKGLIYHCEVDAHDCFPVDIEEIIEDIKSKCHNKLINPI